MAHTRILTIAIGALALTAMFTPISALGADFEITVGTMVVSSMGFRFPIAVKNNTDIDFASPHWVRIGCGLYVGTTLVDSQSTLIYIKAHSIAYDEITTSVKAEKVQCSSN